MMLSLFYLLFILCPVAAVCWFRQYTGYHEEGGTLSDGRHFKNYYLVDDHGAEKLMVMAEDGARLDRRYTYKAVEDVGGFCFENGKAVSGHCLSCLSLTPCHVITGTPCTLVCCIYHLGEPLGVMQCCCHSFGVLSASASLLHSAGLCDPDWLCTCR